MALDKTVAAKNAKVDLCYLASIWSSTAPEDRLVMMLDWNNCVRTLQILLGGLKSYADRYSFLTIVCYPISPFFPPSFSHHRHMLTPDRRIEFDEGHLRIDLLVASEEIEAVTAIMEGHASRYSPASNRIRYIFQTCCDRVRATSSEGTIISSSLILACFECMLAEQACWQGRIERY